MNWLWFVVPYVMTGLTSAFLWESRKPLEEFVARPISSPFLAGLSISGGVMSLLAFFTGTFKGFQESSIPGHTFVMFDIPKECLPCLAFCFGAFGLPVGLATLLVSVLHRKLGAGRGFHSKDDAGKKSP